MPKPAKIMPPRGKTAGLWEYKSPFVIPFSVEKAFTDAMECPHCHSNLLLDSPPPKEIQKIYCPRCGWKPRTSAWEMQRETMAFSPEMWQFVKNHPLYHVTHRQFLNDILAGGLRPSSEVGNARDPGFFAPRPGHIYFYSDLDTAIESARYMDEEVEYGGETTWNDPVVLQIDTAQLDPQRFKADEDYALERSRNWTLDEGDLMSEYGYPNAPDVPKPQMQTDEAGQVTFHNMNPGPSLGEWADLVGLDSPQITQDSYDRGYTVAYEGIIPPSAIQVVPDTPENYALHNIDPEVRRQYMYGKTTAHVDVDVQYTDDAFSGMPGIKAFVDGKDVGTLVTTVHPDYIFVHHAEIDREYRDTDVFLQLASGLMRWMNESGNVKPISMRTIYPGLKRLVDRWNARFENVSPEVITDLWSPELLFGPEGGEFNYLYANNQGAFDVPPTVNPVNYQFVPFTDQELATWEQVPRSEKARWKRRVRDLNQRARRIPGVVGTITGRDAFLLMNRWQGNCAYCGKPGADSFDHAIPMGQGGPNEIGNLLPAHKLCNHELNEWDKGHVPNAPPTLDQMSPNWLMQPAEAHRVPVGAPVSPSKAILPTHER